VPLHLRAKAVDKMDLSDLQIFCARFIKQEIEDGVVHLRILCKSEQVSESNIVRLVTDFRQAPLIDGENACYKGLISADICDEAMPAARRRIIKMFRPKFEQMCLKDFECIADENSQRRLRDYVNSRSTLERRGEVLSWRGFYKTALHKNAVDYSGFNLIRDFASDDGRRLDVETVPDVGRRYRTINENFARAGIHIDPQAAIFAPLLQGQMTRDEKRAVKALVEANKIVGKVGEDAEEALRTVVTAYKSHIGVDDLAEGFTETLPGDGDLVALGFTPPRSVMGVMRLARSLHLRVVRDYLMRIKGQESEFQTLLRLIDAGKLNDLSSPSYKPDFQAKAIEFTVLPFDLNMPSKDVHEIDKHMAKALKARARFLEANPSAFSLAPSVKPKPRPKGRGKNEVSEPDRGKLPRAPPGPRRKKRKSPNFPPEDGKGPKALPPPQIPCKHGSMCYSLHEGFEWLKCQFMHTQEMIKDAKALKAAGKAPIPKNRSGGRGRRVPRKTGGTHQRRAQHHIRPLTNAEILESKRASAALDRAERLERVRAIRSVMDMPGWSESQMRKLQAQINAIKPNSLASHTVKKQKQPIVVDSSDGTAMSEGEDEMSTGQRMCATPIPMSPEFPSDVGSDTDFSIIDLDTRGRALEPFTHFNQSIEAHEMRAQIRTDIRNGSRARIHRMTLTAHNDFTTAMVKLRRAHSHMFRKVKVALDPCSTIDEFNPRFAEMDPSRTRKRVQSRDMVSLSGAPCSAVLSVGSSQLMVHGFMSKNMPTDCHALLSRATIRHLMQHHALDFNAHMLCEPGVTLDLQIRTQNRGGDQSRPVTSKKRLKTINNDEKTKPTKRHKTRVRGAGATSSTDSSVSAAKRKPYPDLNWETEEVSRGPEQAHARKNHQCFVSHALMEDFLRRNPIEKEGQAKQLDNVSPHLRVEVNDDLPQDVQARIRNMLEKHKKAFQTTDTGLCKPLNVPPCKFLLKKGAKLPKVPQQRFNPAAEKLSRHLTKCHVKSGLLEPAFRSTVASRTHFAKKAAKGEGVNGPNFKIRECGDYREINECIERTVPVLPDGHKLIRELQQYSH
ncbi:MAG: hypothetical protein ACPG66_09885, partial [Flavobacteriales bacterium]